MAMKKKWVAAVLIAIALVLCAGGTFLFINRGRRPFKNLDAAQIELATVTLGPPDQTIEIPDIPEMVEYLKDVVIYNRDDSYTEYAGQGAIFTLTPSDGTQTQITECYPFLIIDGVGYKTKHEPCEALNHYAISLR